MNLMRKYFAGLLVGSIMISLLIINSTYSANKENKEATIQIAEEIQEPLKLSEENIDDLTSILESNVIIVEKPELLSIMNAASLKKEEVIPDFPFEVNSLGLLNIVAHNKKHNDRGNQNFNNMTVTINPKIAPYGSILYIDGLGFRYNQPSDYSDETENVYVYFYNDKDIEKWNNQELKVYLVKNEPYINFSGNPKIKAISKGKYRLTAYCPCAICCEKYGAGPENKTGAIGTNVYQGSTVAADPNVLPYGSVIYIEGVGIRFVNDCGGGVKTNRIDVYYYDHYEALKFGRKNANVWVLQ